MQAVTVLYEDQRGPRTGFGLHELVKACVFDLVDGERHRIEAMLEDARPLKGVEKLLRVCREEVDLISADGRSVVAVVDDDVIRKKLGLPADAPLARVEQEIRKGSRAPERLFVGVIEQNTESVIEAAAACDPTLDRALVELAVRHKAPTARDKILIGLSRERARHLRDCVLGRMPSLRRVVELLARVLGHPAEPAPALLRPAPKPRKRGKPSK